MPTESKLFSQAGSAYMSQHGIALCILLEGISVNPGAYVHGDIYHLVEGGLSNKMQCISFSNITELLEHQDSPT